MPTTNQEEASTAEPPAVVRVRGHVRHGGFPVPDYDLEFYSHDSMGGDTDRAWDFTDDEGRFDVLLPPASYTVRATEDELSSRDFVVPEGTEEFVLNIDLP